MIKLVYCLTKRKDVTHEAFIRYWRNEHAKNVRSVQQAIGAVRYVQSHSCEPELNTLLAESRGMASGYDGVTEVWWNSADDLKAAFATPEGARAMQFLIDDESTFIDFSRSRLFMTEEHEIF